MVELARVKLRSVRCRDGGDEENTALNAFECLCTWMAQGRFPSCHG